VPDLEDRKSWTKETFGLEPDTTNDTDSHALPPDPDDELKSTIRSSQAPISLAIDNLTTGAFTTEGADIITFCGSFDFQLEQDESTFEVQRAFKTPPLSTHTLSTRKEEVKDPKEKISREDALIHRQRNEEGEGIVEGENNSPQFISPVRLVGEVKVTVTLLPSEENSDLCTSGADRASSTPFTTNISPTGNTTL
jgi:hypothetical protein